MSERLVTWARRLEFEPFRLRVVGTAGSGKTQLALAVLNDAVDELIIDEGQDFFAEWAAPLLARLRPGGRARWLEDPMQNLYGRDPLALPGFTTLRADTNYRSPRVVLGYVNRLLQPERPLAAKATC